MIKTVRNSQLQKENADVQMGPPSEKAINFSFTSLLPSQNNAGLR